MFLVMTRAVRAAGDLALKENVQPSNGLHPAPDSNGHSKGVDAEPRMLAEVAETSLVRDVLCACQAGFHQTSACHSAYTLRQELEAGHTQDSNSKQCKLL